MESIFQIDGEKDGELAFLGNYRAQTREDAVAMAQAWSGNVYTLYTVFAILPAH